jgi:hypothetical protein
MLLLDHLVVVLLVAVVPFYSDESRSLDDNLQKHAAVIRTNH